MAAPAHGGAGRAGRGGREPGPDHGLVRDGSEHEGTAEQEAEWFVAAFRLYVDKAIPCLDWEVDALGLGVAWTKKWFDRVKVKTGVTPASTRARACFSPTTERAWPRNTR